MWDERYQRTEYCYGEDPVPFLTEAIRDIPAGTALDIGAGEGRNAVWLAEQGFQTTALDGSIVGLNKAAQLASRRGVMIALEHTDISMWDPGVRRWDLIILFFFHLPPDLRKTVHALASTVLNPGGYIVLQGFTPRQMGRGTGGPGSGKNSPDTGNPPAESLFFEPEEIGREFPGLVIMLLKEREISLTGGIFHEGIGAVVEMIAKKPAAGRELI